MLVAWLCPLCWEVNDTAVEFPISFRNLLEWAVGNIDSQLDSVLLELITILTVKCSYY